MSETCYDQEPTFAKRYLAPLLPKSEEDAMDVLQEAFDGILEEMSDEQVLELASLSYVRCPFTCPVCGTHDISAGPVKSNDGAVWSDVECTNSECRAEWQEDMEIVGCDFSIQGYLPDNWRELWLKQREGER